MKSIYRWHRRLSMIIALPLVLAAGSGMLHPLMTNFRPAVATQVLLRRPVDKTRLTFSPSDALRGASIDSVHRVRLVCIDTNWFYQVQVRIGEVPVYLSTKSGKPLPKGDWLYAQYLARQFLEGPGPAAPGEGKAGSRKVRQDALSQVGLGSSMGMEMAPAAGMPGCCSPVSYSVLNAKGSKVSDEAFVTHFNKEYSEVNKVLPVYKVSFDRPDSIRIYVETLNDRFAFAVDNRRAAFNRVFQLTHTLSFLDFLGKGKLIIEFALSAIAFIASVLGLWIFFSTRSKPVPGNTYVRARRNHRYTAAVISLFTLTFAFSGAYHAIQKLKEDTRDRYFDKANYPAAGLDLDSARVAKMNSAANGISLVGMQGRKYWQIPGQKISYIDSDNGQALAGGDSLYAIHLASLFSALPGTQVRTVRRITRFDSEYNFANKRLPVWKVTFSQNQCDQYYVETSSGCLAAHLGTEDLIEGYSFGLLHKHEFMAWAGKTAKDTSTIFWGAMQFVVVIFGLALYLAARKRKAVAALKVQA